MNRTNHGAAKQAARDIANARRALADARRRLAAATRPDSPAVLHESAWRHAHAAHSRHQERLRAIPGVVGTGVGYRRKGGERLFDERCVLVFVRKKRTPAVLLARRVSKIPRSLIDGHGHRVRTDVIEFGRLIRQANGGDSIGPGTIAEQGTLGAFAIDLETKRAVALVSKHVIGGPDIEAPDSSLVVNSPSTSSRRLGIVLRGFMSGIDAAAVSIEPPQSASGMINGIGAIGGWRPLANPGDVGTAVMMFGAQTANVVFGRIVEPSISLPQFGLDDAILADIPSVNGDSGAAILDHDRLVLGLLVGFSSSLNHRVFCPIGSILARLHCDIP